MAVLLATMGVDVSTQATAVLIITLKPESKQALPSTMLGSAYGFVLMELGYRKGVLTILSVGIDSGLQW